MTIYDVILTFLTAFFPDTLDYPTEIVIQFVAYSLTFFVAIFIVYSLFKVFKMIVGGFKK